MTNSMIITVDGPSGAGKGTLCQLLANHTQFALLDSGALYRLTALASLNAGIDLGANSQDAISKEAEIAAIAQQLDVVFHPIEQGIQVLLAGQDVTRAIRQEAIGMAASQVAALTAVRSALLIRQRGFATPQGLIADGRDMGTVVFPQAKVKIFLTASAEERAKRRVLQLEQAGQPTNYAHILRDIEERDRRDTQRKSSPLVPASDALQLDSTRMSIEAVFNRAIEALNT